MSTKNFTQYFPYRAGNDDPLSVVDFGIVKLEEDANPEEVKRRLRRILPTDVAVYTKQEFIDLNSNYFGARVSELDFSKASALSTIN